MKNDLPAFLLKALPGPIAEMLPKLGPTVERLIEQTSGYRPSFVFGFTEGGVEQFERQHKALVADLGELIAAISALPFISAEENRGDECLDGLASYSRDVERLCDHARTKLAPGEAARTPAGDEQVPPASGTTPAPSHAEPGPGGADLTHEDQVDAELYEEAASEAIEKRLKELVAGNGGQLPSKESYGEHDHAWARGFGVNAIRKAVCSFDMCTICGAVRAK